MFFEEDEGKNKMATKVVELTCPGCGARVSIGQSNCVYCRKPIVITTFNSVSDMLPQELDKYTKAYRVGLAESPDDVKLNKSVAICYLKLKQYEKAISAFDKVIQNDINDSEAYFYMALCMLHGKKAFLTPRADIDRAIEYIESAIMIEPKGIYYYFEAYIKYDFFERKYLNTHPNYKECLDSAMQSGVSEFDKETLFSMLGVSQIAF
jgi:tetratricopeptide (TPR) repeat protein